MAKKVILRDENLIEVMPITRAELVLDSAGNLALHSPEFLATNTLPGLMSPDDKLKLEIVAGNTVDTELSNTSTNPVQNKVLTQIINSIRDKYLKSAVISGNKITITDQSNNTVEFVNSTYQIVTNAIDGLVPKYDTVDGTIDTQITDWVLTNHNGTLGWYKLPTNAFKNDNTNTTYSLSGALSGNTYITTLTDSASVKTTATVPAMSGASSTAAGSAGLVPAPAANKHTAFLRGDGAWAVPTFTNTGVRSVTTGTTNGTISVNTNGTTADVAVKGLATAAYINKNLLANYTKGNNYIAFNLYDSSLHSVGLGEGYIEYYDNGAWYNSRWGWVEAVNGFKGSLTGNASSATKLQTKRKLWGLNFDGSADVNGNLIMGSSGAGLHYKAKSGDWLYFPFFLHNSADSAVLFRATFVGKDESLSYFSLGPTLGSFTITNKSLVGIGTASPTERLEVSGNVKATSFIGNLDGTYVNKLTGYAKATAIAALATTDSLNKALGKLEYKADVAYDLVKGAYDGDGTIENLAEILKVLDGIKDTDTIQAIIGKYLPLTGGTLTGSLTIGDKNNLDFKFLQLSRLNRGIRINNTSEAAYITFGSLTDGNGLTLEKILTLGDNNLRYSPDTVNYYNVLHAGNSYIKDGVITINGTSITPVTSRGYIGTTAIQASSQLLALTGITNLTMNGTYTNNNKLVIHSSGCIYPYSTSTRTAGMYGKYDSTKVGHVWSMGTDYKITDDGSSTNNMYGLVYFHTNWSNDKTRNTATRDGSLITEVSTYAGGHQIAFVVNGKVTASLGDRIWARAGFLKSGSSDSYVLLGGGGHKKLSDFLLKSEELTNNLTTITKTLTVTLDWMDTGISSTALKTGTYIVQIYAENTTNGLWRCYWSGVMTWYAYLTDDTETDEIILHRSGHNYNRTIYLRTVMQRKSYLKLQIAASLEISSTTYTFKFKKLI